MRLLPLLLPFLLIIISSCSPLAPVSEPPQTMQLSPAQRNKIGLQIWKNECSGTTSGLTTWNDGEEFPSLGIGHFIWYPAQFQGPYTESFPQFVQYAQSRGYSPPQIALLADCPWRTQSQFQADFHSPALTELRTWLANHVTLQADFIISKSLASLQTILAHTPVADRERVLANYQKVATTTNGQYALIDYVNFKGEGTNPKERYHGYGWGLLHVLSDMNETSGGSHSAIEFAAAAKRMLARRIAHSDPARGEERWRAGWFNRCDTYATPF